MNDSLTIVLGVIGQDVHNVGNKLLEYALKKQGFRTVNLGIAVSQAEFVHAAVETGAHAILVSSLYGHGELDCRGLREKCVEAGLCGLRLYVGGMLVVGKQPWAEVEARFRAMGFDRVGSPGISPTQVAGWLKEDLAAPPTRNRGAQ